MSDVLDKQLDLLTSIEKNAKKIIKQRDDLLDACMAWEKADNYKGVGRIKTSLNLKARELRAQAIAAAN